MKKEQIDVLYDENGQAIRVQMDFDLYEWLMEQVPAAEEQLAMAS